MRKTQLFIKVNNAWKEIDLFDDVVVPITMKVTDIRQFGSKTSSYSLDFDIPHTSNNAHVFGLNSEIDVYESTFEVGKDYPAYMTNDTFTVFDGQFRLKKVIKKNNGSYIYYVGYLYGGAKNFIDSLGTDKLIGNDDPSKDLNFSEYAVTASEMTLQDFYYYLQSHDTAGGGWGLTLLDKTNKAAQAFSGGSQQWYTDECTPYLYAREIFDKLFPSTGYTYVSEFMQGTDFSTYIHDPRWANGIGKYDVNSLIYPYMRHNSGIKVSTPVSSVITQNDPTTFAVISQVEYYRESSLSESNLIAHSLKLNQTDFTLTEQNASSDITSYQFTATQNGYYTVNWNFNVEARIMLRNVSNNAPAGFERIDTQGNKPYTVWVQMEKNGTLIGNRIRVAGEISGTWTKYSEYSPISEMTESYVTITSGTLNYQSNGLWLNIGDTLGLYMWMQIPVQYQVYNQNTHEWVTKWVWWHDSSQGGTEWHYDFYPKYSQIKLTNNGNPIISNTINDGFYEENAFDPTSILNPKTSKVDYFNIFVKMFNLYVEDVSGKTNYKTGGIYAPNTLRIEPYEIFYNPELGGGLNNVKDWTDKIDWESVEYRRCDDYLYNIQSFTKKQDKDFYNDNYNNTYVTPYGNREVKGVYCTGSDRNEIGLNVSANLCGIVNNSTDVLQCPKVFALDKSGNLDTKKEYSDGIFFIWHNKMSANTDLTTNYTLKLQSRLHSGSGSYYNVTDYFCADTLNKGYGLDDANLNWGGTETYYQNMKGTIPTYNDLYSAFYSKEYEEKTAQDAKIMRANIYLTAHDIYNVQLSDMIIINGNYWHILEINQWKDEKTACQIELIKTQPRSTIRISRPKPNPVIDLPILPIANDNSTLMLQLSQLSEELKDTNDRLDDANEQISELEEQLAAIPDDSVKPNANDEYKIPLRIVFNDMAAGKQKTVSTKVSEPLYEAMQVGSWNTSTVSTRNKSAVIVLNRNKPKPTSTSMRQRTDFSTLYSRAQDKLDTQQRQRRTRREIWKDIPKKRNGSTDNNNAKKGLYAASWQYKYA